MSNPSQRVGRPRRGTEQARIEALLGAATRVFLTDGYGLASIDRVAHEAGVSTRTIYERYRNKADLLAAVITRLIDHDMEAIFSPAEFELMEPRHALMTIAETTTRRACDPNSAALFRIVVTEAQRFPELAAKMRHGVQDRINTAVANYLRGQVRGGALSIADPERAASLFMGMVCAEWKECLLFGSIDDLSRLDFSAYLREVVDIFLCGTLPRGDVPAPRPTPRVPA